MVLDCSDEYPDCAVNEFDCAEVCGGNSENDECGVCDGPGTIYGDTGCCENDLDECGVCGGDNSSCADCLDVPNGDAVFDNCGVCDNDPSNDCAQLSIALDGLDLVSFYALPADNNIESMLDDITDYDPGVMGEGNSAYYINDMWMGSLMSIEHEDGYWIKISGETELEVEGLPTDPTTLYSLHDGSNLVSYPFSAILLYSSITD